MPVSAFPWHLQLLYSLAAARRAAQDGNPDATKANAILPVTSGAGTSPSRPRTCQRKRTRARGNRSSRAGHRGWRLTLVLSILLFQADELGEPPFNLMKAGH